MIKRPLRELLALPLNGREERLADMHILRESARIRESWSEREHHQRAGLPHEPWGVPEVHGDDPDPE